VPASVFYRGLRQSGVWVVSLKSWRGVVQASYREAQRVLESLWGGFEPVVSYPLMFDGMKRTHG
jgi:hypothetical protein